MSLNVDRRVNVMRLKYPRTFHLPWSPGATSDDKTLDDVSHFRFREVIVSEKMDGENTSCYSDGYTHARSIDSVNHPSRNWVKRFWAERYFKLPHGYRVCGENVYAEHSVGYDSLPSYFLGFSVWDDELCLSWDDTLLWFSELGITPVREIYRGIFDEKMLRDLHIDFTKQEGYVVRIVDSFTLDQFPMSVAKFVRKGHVQTDDHWMNKEVIPNKLLKNIC